jgi:thiol:disulfide interchange protein DsbD
MGLVERWGRRKVVKDRPLLLGVPARTPKPQAGHHGLNSMGKNRSRGANAACLAFLILACSAPALCAATSPVDAHSQHTELDLVAEEAAAVPGETAWLGLHFVLDPGWHIYWQNPGDSGEPPRAQWHLPAGFRPGEIEWPAPERLGSGAVIDFGYSGEVLLMIPVAIPANAAPGASENLAATAKWLVCREICIPDQAQLSLKMAIVAHPMHAATAGEALFAQFRKLIPRAVPSNWSVKAIARGNDFILSVETGQPEDHAAFYPFLPDPIENSATQTVTRLSKGVQLQLHKSDQQTTPVVTLKGVLVLGDPRGSGNSSGIAAYQIAVPVPLHPVGAR